MRRKGKAGGGFPFAICRRRRRSCFALRRDPLLIASGGTRAVPCLRARVTFGRSPKSDQKGCLKPQVSRLPARLQNLFCGNAFLALRARWQQRLNVALTFFYPRCRSSGKMQEHGVLPLWRLSNRALAAAGGKCRCGPTGRESLEWRTSTFQSKSGSAQRKKSIPHFGIATAALTTREEHPAKVIFAGAQEVLKPAVSSSPFGHFWGCGQK